MMHPGRRKRQRHAKDNAPTVEEYERLLDAARDERDRLSILVLGEGGFRANEFLHIRPAWLQDGKVRIPLADPTNGFTAKTKRGARAVPLWGLHRPAWDALTDHFTDHEALGFKYHALRLRTIAAGKRAGLEKHVTPHALRAYCATKWAYNFGSPFLLMDLMGWTRPEVAIVYVRSTGRGLEDALRSWNGNGHGRGNRLQAFRDRWRRRGRR